MQEESLMQNNHKIQEFFAELGSQIETTNLNRSAAKSIQRK